MRAHQYKEHLSPGETAVVLCLSQDKDQAGVLLGYCQGILETSPRLRSLLPTNEQGEVKEPSGDSIKLNNGIQIRVKAASFRSLRGFTACAVLADEIAFWRDSNSRNPADFILKSVRPTLASMPGSMLLAFSSPWAKSGVLWDHHKSYYKENDPHIICFQGASRTLNPTLPKRVVEKAIKKDPEMAKTEYLAQFRTDVQVLFSDENLDPVIVPGRRVLQPQKGITYFAAVDASGGSSDSFTMAIAHMDPDTLRLVLDLVAERKPPFSPQAVCVEFSRIMKKWGCHSASADKYAKGWVEEGFSLNKITLHQEAPPKTELYQELLARINSEEVELLDHDALRGQLECLERHVRPGGQEKIYEPPNAHDDLANAAALALWEVGQRVQEEEPAATFMISEEELEELLTEEELDELSDDPNELAFFFD